MVERNVFLVHKLQWVLIVRRRQRRHRLILQRRLQRRLQPTLQPRHQRRRLRPRILLLMAASPKRVQRVSISTQARVCVLVSLTVEMVTLMMERSVIPVTVVAQAVTRDVSVKTVNLIVSRGDARLFSWLSAGLKTPRVMSSVVERQPGDQMRSISVRREVKWIAPMTTVVRRQGLTPLRKRHLRVPPSV